MARKNTNKLIEYVEEGLFTWEDVARAALNYMKDDEVGDMMRRNEYDKVFLPRELEY